jgi:hypothetical protein
LRRERIWKGCALNGREVTNMGYIVLRSQEDIDRLREQREKDVAHFDGSYALAEAFWNGLIDWDGNELY